MLMSAEITDIGGEKCMIASITDITYLKKIEQDLRKSEERFAKAFNSTPGILSITKASDGTFLEINDSFTPVFGFTRKETIGHKSLELNLWVNPNDRVSMVHQLMETGNVRNKEYLHRTKSGDIRTLLFSAVLIEFDGEPCALAMTNDITEYKSMEAEAHEAVNLRELDRLRTELLANVSHSCSPFNSNWATTDSDSNSLRICLRSSDTIKLYFSDVMFKYFYKNKQFYSINKIKCY